MIYAIYCESAAWDEIEKQREKKVSLGNSEMV